MINVHSLFRRSRRGGRMNLECLNCFTADSENVRRRIDASMIGLPSEFRHVSHVGITNSGQSLQTLQNVMGSKGELQCSRSSESARLMPDDSLLIRTTDVPIQSIHGIALRT